MGGLTRKQTEVLAYIKGYIEEHGFAPTLEEMAQHFGVSNVTVFEHVRALEAKGEIRTERNRARSIELVQPTRWPRIPLAGRIAAGLPIEATESRDAFEFDEIVPDDGDTFILEVKGNSMIEDHILDGDFVVVGRRDAARAGDTVVALIRDEEATLKRFYPEGSRVRLEPANATMRPIIVDANEVRIQGIVTGVMRRY